MAEFSLENIKESDLETVSAGAFQGACFRYQIQPGDCLSVLAQRFGTNVNTLCEINRIQNPNFIRAHDWLLIPWTGIGVAR